MVPDQEQTTIASKTDLNLDLIINRYLHFPGKRCGLISSNNINQGKFYLKFES